MYNWTARFASPVRELLCNAGNQLLPLQRLWHVLQSWRTPWGINFTFAWILLYCAKVEEILRDSPSLPRLHVAVYRWNQYCDFNFFNLTWPHVLVQSRITLWTSNFLSFRICVKCWEMRHKIDIWFAYTWRHHAELEDELETLSPKEENFGWERIHFEFLIWIDLWLNGV